MYDNPFVLAIMISASPCSICLHLIPTWRRLLTSAQEPRLMYRNRANSLLVCLSKPSAILEDIDVVARRIWSRYQKLFESPNFVKSSLNKSIEFCHTINSSKFLTFIISKFTSSQTSNLRIPKEINILLDTILTSGTSVTPGTSFHSTANPLHP